MRGVDSPCDRARGQGVERGDAHPDHALLGRGGALGAVVAGLLVAAVAVAVLTVVVTALALRVAPA